MSDPIVVSSLHGFVLADGITAVLKENIDICAGVLRTVDSGSVEGVGRLALIERPPRELHRYLVRRLGVVRPHEGAPAERALSGEPA